MPKNKIIRKRYLLSIIVLLVFMSCNNDPCPEGSVAQRDAEGNVIDCFDPLNQ